MIEQPNTMPLAPILESRIICPMCGFVAVEAMPIDACRFFYACINCHTRLVAKEGDCCVFCSYGDMPCPSMQAINAGCGCVPPSVPDTRLVTE